MSEREEIIANWWWHQIGNRESAAARGLAARLRRAASPLDVLAEPQVHDLAHRLTIMDSDKILRLVRVLSEVRDDRGGPLAKRLGPGLREDPALSNPRFERLIRSEGGALIAALRRTLPLVDRTCAVGRLGADLLHWNEKTRIRWTFEYYGTELPASLAPEGAEEETAQ